MTCALTTYIFSAVNFGRGSRSNNHRISCPSRASHAQHGQGIGWLLQAPHCLLMTPHGTMQHNFTKYLSWKGITKLVVDKGEQQCSLQSLASCGAPNLGTTWLHMVLLLLTVHAALLHVVLILQAPHAPPSSTICKVMWCKNLQCWLPLLLENFKQMKSDWLNKKLSTILVRVGTN